MSVYPGNLSINRYVGYLYIAKYNNRYIHLRICLETDVISIIVL